MTVPATHRADAQAHATSRMADAHAPVSTASIIRGLVWRERLLHGRVVDAYVAAWLIAVWGLRLIDRPAALALYGFALAIQLGSRLGASEWKDHSEEFLFALPPTRAQRFWFRAGAGLLPVLLLVGSAAVAVDWNLPARLWSLISDGPFTAPTAPRAASSWWCAVMLPIAAYLITYATHAALPRRGRSYALVILIALGVVCLMQVNLVLGGSGPLHAIDLSEDLARVLLALGAAAIVLLVASRRFARRAPAAAA